MDRSKNYDVVFSGLKNGKHHFQFNIDKAFFALFETDQEFTEPDLIAEVWMDKHTTFLEFEIAVKGSVQLTCDISNQQFREDLQSDIKVLVKFGEEYDDSDVEVITIPAGDHAFNVAQLIYESVMLAVPMKKIAPDLSAEDLEILERFEPKEETKTATDPRWEALQKLKDKN